MIVQTVGSQNAVRAVGRFAQQASLSLIGNLVYSAGQWFAIVVLSRRLGLVAVGQVSLALSIIGPVLVFFSFNLRTVVAADVSGVHRLRDYAIVRAVSLLCACVVVLAIGLSIGSTVPMLLIFVFMLIGRAADLAVDVLYGSLQRADMNGTVGLSLAAHGAMPLVAAVCLLSFSQSASTFAAGIALGSVLAVLLVDLPLARRTAGPAVSPMIKTDGLGRLIKNVLVSESLASRRPLVYALMPFGLIALLGSLYQNVPRYFLVGDEGTLAIGQFTSLLYLTFVPYTVVSAAATAAAPRLSVAVAESRSKFFRLLLGLAALAVLLGLALLALGMFAGPMLERAIYGQVVAPSPAARMWMLATAMPWYLASVLSIAATALRESRVQLVGHVTAAAVTLAGCMLLAHDYGVAGVGAALFSGLVALAAIELYSVHRAVQQVRGAFE